MHAGTQSLSTKVMVVSGSMKKKNPAAVELGRRGGLARKKALSAKERKEIATIASRAAAEKRTKAKKATTE
jgi:hypothetical protein